MAATLPYAKYQGLRIVPNAYPLYGLPNNADQKPLIGPLCTFRAPQKRQPSTLSEI
jgi:hypothetical protein